MSENPTPTACDVDPHIPEDEAGVLLPAAMVAMVMTGVADGSLGQNEKDALVEVSYAANRWHMSPHAILTQLQTLVDIITELDKKDWPKLFEKARGLSGKSKIDILRACAKMAHMDDGTMCLSEQQRIDSIASWIEIEPHDLETWNAEYKRVKEGDIA